MKSAHDRSLKSQYMKWLVMLAVADVLAMLWLIAPEMAQATTLSQAGVRRILTATVMPVAVLLIVNVLPPALKTILVYWKLRNALPGCQAFTKHGPNDPRFEMTDLSKNIGTLPTDPSKQNARWFGLYQLVSKEPTVVEAHKQFLMYRDMAGLSLLMTFFVPFSLYFSGAKNIAPHLAVALFGIQYVLSALSARWSGIGFVCNVLAIHAYRRIKKATTVV